MRDIGIDKISKSNSDKLYFFTKKNIGYVYDANIFQVMVSNMKMVKNSVKFNITLTHKFIDYNIYLIYLPDDTIYYGPDDTFKDIRGVMGEDNMELYDELTNMIINDNLPIDFWEVKNMKN